DAVPHTIPISSLSDPRVAEYANLRDAELRHRADPDSPVLGARGLFMAEGELVVRRLLTAGPRFVTRSILATPARLESIRAAAGDLPHDIPIYVAEPPTLNSIVGFNMHRGILAIGAPVGTPTVDSLAGSCRLLVVLEDLVNHDNIGGIFRSAAALAGP